MTRFFLFFLFTVLIAMVFGSSLDGAENASDDDQDDFEQPSVIKHKFINAVAHAQVPECKYFIEKYDYLNSRFNRDVFEAMISCFDLEGRTEDCWEIFEMIQPSFEDVSSSTTTPLIMSLRKNKMEIFKALISLDNVKSTVDNVDEFARTALMYAAKRGSYFAIIKLIEMSTNSIGKKDFMDKTVLHYACEMNLIEICKVDSEPSCNADNKYSIFVTLLHNGAKIDYHGPEFKLNSEDGVLKDLIIAKGGKVYVTKKPEDLIFKGLIGLTALQVANTLKITEKAVYLAGKVLPLILANPLMIALNEMCFQIQKTLLPGLDLNLVLSFDLGNEFQDISLNLFFLMLLIPMFNSFVEMYNKQNAFKF